MKKLRLHIALGLVGMFLFPVIFQSVHTARHKKECCTGLENSCATGVPYKDLKTTCLSQQAPEEHCPVCNYQFPVNEFPGLSLYSTIIPVTTGIVCEIILPADFRVAFSTKSPRAPPSFM